MELSEVCSSNSMAVSFMLPQVMVTEKEHVSLITAGRNVPCSSRVAVAQNRMMNSLATNFI